MRLYTKWQQTNANESDPTLPKPKEVKMAPTASTMQVFQRFGHLMWPQAIRPVDSDGPVMVTANVNTADANANSTVASLQAIPITSLKATETITSGAFDALMQNAKAVNTEVVSITLNSAETPSKTNFSPSPIATGAEAASNTTSDQHQRPSTHNNSKIHSIKLRFWHKRCEYIEQLKKQANESHAMRAAVYQRQLAFWDAAIADRCLKTTASAPTAIVAPFNWNVQPSPVRTEEIDYDDIEYLTDPQWQAEDLFDMQDVADSSDGIPDDDPNDADYVP